MANKPSTEIRVGLIIGYATLIAVNVAASKGWLGPTNAKLSKRNPTPIDPATWAFSIWGLIFLLQGAAVIYQAIGSGYDVEGKALAVQAVGWFWIAGWMFQNLWQVLFQLQTRLGTWLCMFALLAALASFAVALKNVDTHLLKGVKSDWSFECSVESEGLAWKGFFAVPTSINTAWLSVASCIGILMVYMKEGLPKPAWAAVVLAGVATAAGIYRLLAMNDTAYGLVLLWALFAVYQRQETWPVGIAAAVGCILCGAGAIITLFRMKPILVKGDYMHQYTEL